MIKIVWVCLAVVQVAMMNDAQQTTDQRQAEYYCGDQQRGIHMEDVKNNARQFQLLSQMQQIHSNQLQRILQHLNLEKQGE